ncbi:hypothetical protein NP493_615g00028 [Ridgeia piscesae]|uniref:Uncharacterized protein n=1 Tax=Ridgeia piscesae TaxID=27915 RepID=A0AAD9KTD2_RIDPI|nr:hypothetical protein NP493_615g00028 [Ridgeia piscesae]
MSHNVTHGCRRPSQVQMAAESAAIIEDNGHPVEPLMNCATQQRPCSVSAARPTVLDSLQIAPPQCASEQAET